MQRPLCTPISEKTKFLFCITFMDHNALSATLMEYSSYSDQSTTSGCMAIVAFCLKKFFISVTMTLTMASSSNVNLVCLELY